jgi:hypothetical protein
MGHVSGLHAWLTVLVLVVPTACVRVVTPQGVPLKVLGEGCDAATQCASGFCQDGVCCRTGCSEQQACNLERSPGTCTQRTLGDPCAHAPQCPLGHCVDGVCCNTACTQPCLSCRLPDAPGQCGLALDNTDQRGDCPSTCTACFGGLCLPALPGTDPGGSCANGLACGVDSQCHIATGQVCEPPGDCAAGLCLGGQCALPTLAGVTSDLLVPDALRTHVLAMAAGPSGDVSMLVQQWSTGLEDTATLNVTYLRETPQGWSGLFLAQPDRCALTPRFAGLMRRAALVSVGGGDVAFLSTAYPECETRPPGLPGVRVVWTGPSLSEHRSHLLVEPGATTEAVPVTPDEHLDAAFDGVDTLALTWGFARAAPGGTAYPQHVWRYRLSQGAWQDPVEVVPNVYQWGPAVFLAGDLVSFVAPRSSTLSAFLVAADGTVVEAATLDLPPNCRLWSDVALRAHVVTTAAGTPQAVVAGWCEPEDVMDTIIPTPVLVTFSIPEGFGPAGLFDPQDGARVGRFTVAQLSAQRTGLVFVETRGGTVSLAQADATGVWSHTPLTAPLLWGEFIPAFHTAFWAGGPVLAWNADRRSLADGGESHSAISSRLFVWRPYTAGR